MQAKSLSDFCNDLNENLFPELNIGYKTGFLRIMHFTDQSLITVTQIQWRAKLTILNRKAPGVLQITLKQEYILATVANNSWVSFHSFKTFFYGEWSLDSWHRKQS